MHTLAHTQCTYASPGRRTVQAVGILKLNKVTEFDISPEGLMLLNVLNVIDIFNTLFYRCSSSRNKPILNFRCHQSCIYAASYAAVYLLFSFSPVILNESEYNINI